MKENKNILFITSRLLWPVDGGRKMSLNYYCKGLHERFGYTIYLYCFLEKGQHYDGTHPDYIKKVYLAEEVSTAEKLKNLITKTAAHPSWPIQCSLYFSKINLQHIKEICQEIQPQAVFTEMIRTALYYPAFQRKNVKTIANLDDLLSKRYERQAASKRSKANVTGAYAGKMPGFLNKFLKNDFLKNYFLKYEEKRCRIWEKKIYRIYDDTLFTSPIETQEMNQKMQDHKAHTLSVGVDYELFARTIPKLKKERNSLSYVGNFKIAANSDTLKYICEEILPLVKHPYRFYIIGLCPEQLIDQYASESIRFCGRVEDLTEYVGKTQIFLSPISYGTGIKTKIVEAMAMGMPVITNSIGAEGISADSGKELIIEETSEKIAQAVDWLLDNKSVRDRLGSAAQRFVYNHFRWDIVYQAFAEIGL